MILSRIYISLFFFIPIISFCQSKIDNRDSVLQKRKERNKIFRVSFSPLSTGMPIGNFYSKNINNSKAGFATSGGGVKLFAEYDFKKKIGFCAAGIFNNLPISPTPVIASFQQQFGNSYQYNLSSTKWNVASWMVGIYDIVPIRIMIKHKDGTSKKNTSLKFIDRVLLGVSNINTPALSLNMTNGTNSSITVYQPSASTSSFSYLYGIGLRADPPFNRHLSLSFYVDYLSTRANIKNVSIQTNNNGSITNSSSNISQAISVITPSLFLDWHF